MAKILKTGKEHILSVTKDDLEFDYFRAGGKGGQKQNKTSSGVRCRHKESGAVGESRSERSQLQNKKQAFHRMIETKEFQIWIRKKSAESMTGETIEQKIEREMQPQNLRVECKTEKGWLAECALLEAEDE